VLQLHTALAQRKDEYRAPDLPYFRALRTQILLRLREAEKVILICGYGSGEGKTTVARHLGLSLVEAAKSVLLVDANVSAPGLHDCFAVNGKVGLQQLLSGETTVGAAITEVAPALYVLPAGANAADAEKLMGGPLLANIFHGFRKQFDYILVDTPAAKTSSVPELIGRCCDGALIVAGAGQVAAADVRAVRDRLQSTGTRVWGAVLNGASDESFGSGLSATVRTGETPVEPRSLVARSGT